MSGARSATCSGVANRPRSSSMTFKRGNRISRAQGLRAWLLGGFIFTLACSSQPLEGQPVPKPSVPRTEEAPPASDEPVSKEPVVKSRFKVPPISGGTLMVAADGHTAVAADPDRDKIFIV